MKNLSINNYNRIRGLLSFFMTIMFWLLLGSEISNIVSLVIFNINRTALQSPYFIYLKTNLPFAAMALGIFFTRKYLLEISFKELITNNKNYSHQYFLITICISLFYLFSYMIIANSLGYKPIAYNSIPFKNRIIMIILVLLITPIQSALEELLFRSILLRGIVGKYSKTNIAQILIASTLCGLVFLSVHLGNPEISAFRNFAIIYYFTFGFASAFMTLYFGTVEISIALHVSNNLFVGLISNYNNSALKTMSIFSEVDNSAHYFDLVIVILMFITTYFVLKRTTFYKANKNDTNLKVKI